MSVALPQGGQVQLATSLVSVGGQLVLRGALLLPKYSCANSPNGWIGFGLPLVVGGGGMLGAQVFITRPAPGTPTGDPQMRLLLPCTEWPVQVH